jgi:hypothetical protein
MFPRACPAERKRTRRLLDRLTAMQVIQGRTASGTDAAFSSAGHAFFW